MTTYPLGSTREGSVPRTISMAGAIAVHVGAIVLLAVPMMRPTTLAAIAEPIQIIWHTPEPEPMAVPLPPEPQPLPKPRRPTPAVATPVETPPITVTEPTTVAAAVTAPPTDIAPVVDVPAATVEGSRRGADVSLAYIDARAPRYPRDSIREHEEGVVLLRVFVDRVGRPTSVELVRSSGHARLDRAARESVREWRFRPVQVDGLAVPASGLVPVAFNLAKG